ncbi:3-hydroxyacyl-CoA dehydrogenase [Pleurostoma richardsiae]|uniref:3-hydroxyacyl-CoA dehydrogenase n=1 Tax=Pleurostoma richardsiae TaxID=41990 RepID=A0AA38R5I0_9PEZI|nr:3-hydroxyacyl-CoA dehydrogenase [Pleurostoma richardsiae]
MAEIKVDEKVLASLKDRVVVVTGSADGIGAETVRHLFHAGARLVVGDLDDTKGNQLIESLNRESSDHRQNAFYVHVDVSNYDSVISLFRRAIEFHGRVDMAIHCAAITEICGWFAPGITLDSAANPPTSKVLEVNLFGTFYFTHAALAAMNQDHVPEEKVNKSITLIASVAGFKESPGLFAYSASKHGVMGVMRSLRGYLPSVFNTRINVICPWATDTKMLGNVRDIWVQNELPINTADDVARIILHCAADESIHGKAVYVAGGKGFDIEEGIGNLEPQWMGDKQARDLAKGQEVLGTGTPWTKN